MPFISNDPGYNSSKIIVDRHGNDKTTAEIILDIMRTGGIKASVASALEISVRRLSKWLREYPELGELMELGETHSHAWWFKRGKDNLDNPKFNHATWYAIMRNKFGYGDKPSERPQAIAEWGGTIMEKLATLDTQLKNGELAAEQYEHYVKSILHHTKIFEITSIAPVIEKMDAERKYRDGELTTEEYDNKIILIKRKEHMLEMASLNLSKEKKVKDDRLPLKQHRKVIKMATKPEKRYNPLKKDK